MSISIAMVAFGKGAKISPAAVQKELQASFPSLPAPGNVEKKDGTFSFRMGDFDVIFGLMPAPIPWSDLEGPCSASWLWPDASSEMREHRVHVIVTVMADCEPIERLKILTAATAALAGTCDAAVGVYWCDSKVVMSPKMFRDFAIEMIPDGLPLYVWLDFRIGKGSDGKIVGCTTGMSALGHMELETWDCPEPPGELRERLFGLAYYLLENGPVIEDGNTIGEDENERIKIIYSDSKFGHEAQVMRLEYGSPASSKEPSGASLGSKLFGMFGKGGPKNVTLENLQGRWRMVSCGQGGRFAPKDMILGAQIILKIEGDRYTTTIRGEVDEQGTLKVDTTKEPVTFDQYVKTGKDAGRVHMGIVRMRKGDLEHCQAEIGQPRPKDFARKRKDTASLVLFKRL